MVGVFQKWYDFSESGTTFSCISCSRAQEQLSRCWDKLIQRWDELIRKWDRLIQRCEGAISRPCALACVAREEFSEKCFHFHSRLSTGLSRPFPCFWRFTNVSPILWKQCETSATLRACQERPRTFIYRDFLDWLWRWKHFFDFCFVVCKLIRTLTSSNVLSFDNKMSCTEIGWLP